jgi:thiosulfate/3-mercaptopyruvate sulfurtransferase
MNIEATLIAPAQLATLHATEAVVIIDTRDADAFASGHIPGAVNLREVFTFLATSSREGIDELKSTFGNALGAAMASLAVDTTS